LASGNFADSGLETDDDDNDNNGFALGFETTLGVDFASGGALGADNTEHHQVRKSGVKVRNVCEKAYICVVLLLSYGRQHCSTPDLSQFSGTS